MHRWRKDTSSLKLHQSDQAKNNNTSGSMTVRYPDILTRNLQYRMQDLLRQKPNELQYLRELRYANLPLGWWLSLSMRPQMFRLFNGRATCADSCTNGTDPEGELPYRTNRGRVGRKLTWTEACCRRTPVASRKITQSIQQCTGALS